MTNHVRLCFYLAIWLCNRDKQTVSGTASRLGSATIIWIQERIGAIASASPCDMRGNRHLNQLWKTPKLHVSRTIKVRFWITRFHPQCHTWHLPTTEIFQAKSNRHGHLSLWDRGDTSPNIWTGETPSRSRMSPNIWEVPIIISRYFYMTFWYMFTMYIRLYLCLVLPSSTQDYLERLFSLWSRKSMNSSMSPLKTNSILELILAIDFMTISFTWTQILI